MCLNINLIVSLFKIELPICINSLPPCTPVYLQSGKPGLMLSAHLNTAGKSYTYISLERRGQKQIWEVQSAGAGLEAFVSSHRFQHEGKSWGKTYCQTGISALMSYLPWERTSSKTGDKLCAVSWSTLDC